jgi:hypothetical protein
VGGVTGNGATLHQSRAWLATNQMVARMRDAHSHIHHHSHSLEVPWALGSGVNPSRPPASDGGLARDGGRCLYNAKYRSVVAA